VRVDVQTAIGQNMSDSYTQLAVSDPSAPVNAKDTMTAASVEAKETTAEPSLQTTD
jgi:hypothetical protein